MKRKAKSQSSITKFYKKAKRSKPLTKTSFKAKKYSKSTIKSKWSGKPRHVGTGHWLSFGKGVHSNKISGFIRKTEKLLANTHFQYNSVAQVIPTASLQAVANICSAYTVYDIVTYANAVITSGLGIDQPEKVLLKDYNYNIMMTNNSNAPVFVDLYDCICRRDSIDHMTAGISTPVGSWTNSGTPTYYGSTPFESEAFCLNWKVTKVTRLNLALGETAEHIVKGKLGRIWNHDVDNQMFLSLDATPTQTQACLKGLTTYTFAVIKGCPTDAANNTVGSSAAKVDFISTVRYTVQAIQSGTATSTYVATAIAAVAGNIMDTGTGASAAVTSA